jgi:hypothetical protein
VGSKKSLAEMIGEIFREAAVLVAVFVPMDRIVSEDKTFTTGWFWATLILSAALGADGVAVELIRRDE